MLGNWIIQTTTTTGSGDLTVAAVTGYPAFSSQFAVDELFSYVILDDATGLPIERGMGKRGAGGQLIRAKVLSTMASGSYQGVQPSAVALSAGTKRIICTPGSGSVLTAAPGIWTGAQGVGGLKGYGDVHTGGSINVSAPMPAGKAYAIPFIASVDSDIIGLSFRTNGLAAEGFARVAIYSVSENGLPGVKLVESDPISLASGGGKPGTFARIRPPSRFFGCILFDSAVTVSGSASFASNSFPMGYTTTMMPVAAVQADVVGNNFPADWSAATLTKLEYLVQRPVLVALCP